jgi:ATP adenylyltransferase
MTFSQLAHVIAQQMRMSHTYQPVMFMTLLEKGGSCSEEDIARAILAHDQSQVEYYEKITRDMVGPVLRNHHIVSREQKELSAA